MSKLENLITENKEYNKELTTVKNNLVSNLQKLNTALYPIFQKYKECCKDLVVEAQKTGVTIPEIFIDNPGNWGNQGVTEISYENNDYLTLYSNSRILDATSYCKAYLPKRYLQDNALDLIEQDAQRIKKELASIKLSQELNQKNNFRESKKIKI